MAMFGLSQVQLYWERALDTKAPPSQTLTLDRTCLANLASCKHCRGSWHAWPRAGASARPPQRSAKHAGTRRPLPVRPGPCPSGRKAPARQVLIGWGADTVVVSCRGTASFRNALSDIQVLLRPAAFTSNLQPCTRGSHSAHPVHLMNKQSADTCSERSAPCRMLVHDLLPQRQSDAPVSPAGQSA